MNLSRYKSLFEKYGLGEKSRQANKTAEIYDMVPNTIEEHVLSYLVKNCLTANAATTVLDEYKKYHPEMDQRWNDVFDGYPVQMFSSIMIGIKAEALRYIEANMPKTWFKSLFEN